MSVITAPMPADLPTNWTTGQIISPSGTDVGLTPQHGYNYLMQQVNAAQTAANQIDDAVSDINGTLTEINTNWPSIFSLTISSSGWERYSPFPINEYRKTLTISGGTANSKIDLQANVATLSQLQNDKIYAIWVVNSNGTFTVRTLGGPPSNSLTVQAIRTEIPNGGSLIIGDAVSAGFVNIQSGSYVGTGTAGISHENSLTFNFVPEIIFCGSDPLSLGNWVEQGSNGGEIVHLGVMLTASLTTSYQNCYGFGADSSDESSAHLYGKISNDGRTVYWYNQGPPAYQNNLSGTTYYWLAIG